MYTPRHIRKSTRPNKSGAGKKEKSRAFRFAKTHSDRYIHLSADKLEGNDGYMKWCALADKGRIRK